MPEASNDSTVDESDAVELTASERYQLLADERRQITIRALADRRPPVALADLALTVADRDADADSVAISLHHVHLPKLADVDVLDYDRVSRRVEACRIPDDLVL